MSRPTRSLAQGTSGSGSVNTVQRIGDRVHRPTGDWTPAVHSLLCHLEQAGFAGAPRVVAWKGETEILTYIEGEVAMRPWPPALVSHKGLWMLGQMLKQYHRAVEGYIPPEDAHWRNPVEPWRSGQIIRHGDLGPWNMVWEQGELVGFIDWDFAHPGTSLEDLAQVAWLSVPLTLPEKCRKAGIEPGEEQHIRLHLLCEAYGISSRLVLEELYLLQEKEREQMIALGRAGLTPWTLFLSRGDDKEIEKEMNWLIANREKLLTYGCD